MIDYPTMLIAWPTEKPICSEIAEYTEAHIVVLTANQGIYNNTHQGELKAGTYHNYTRCTLWTRHEICIGKWVGGNIMVYYALWYIYNGISKEVTCIKSLNKLTITFDIRRKDQ